MSIWESRLRLAALAAAYVALSLTGCDQILKESALDKTASLPAMRTHCVGRYLIDLPADFEQMLVSDVELTYGMDKNFRTVNVTVARAAGSQPSFDGIVNKRASELAADYHFKSPSKTMLAFRQRLNETTALVRSYDSPDMLDYFKAELFAEKGFSVGLFKADIFKTDTPDDIEAKVLKVVERTSFAPSPDQAGRGTCLGPMLIDAGQDGERLTLAFRSKSVPDVLIEVDMNSMLAKSDGGLLKRWDSKAGMLNKLDFHSTTLRRGTVAVGGMPGEELLNKGKEQGHVVRGFTAEALQTKPATFSTPSLAISMNMGGQLESSDYVDASWSDEGAMAIWDAIVKSIRLRPGAV